jgi:hypothetical protein
MSFLGFNSGQQATPASYDPASGSSGTMIAGSYPIGQQTPNTYSSSGPAIGPTNDPAWRTSSEPPAVMATQTTQVIAANNRNAKPASRQPEPPLYGDTRPVIARSDEGKPTPEPVPVQQREPTPFVAPEHLPLTHEAAPAPPPKANAGPKLPPTQLKKRIEAVCGGAVRNVNVAFEGGKLTVKMELVQGARQEQIVDRVINMPELTPYQEQLELSLQLPTPAAPTEVIQEGPPPRQ